MYPVMVLKLTEVGELTECLTGPYASVLETTLVFVHEVYKLIKKKHDIDDITTLNNLFFEEYGQDFKLNVLEPLKLKTDTLNVILKAGTSLELKNSQFSKDTLKDFLDTVSRVKKQCYLERLAKLQQEMLTAEMKGDNKLATELSKNAQELTTKLKNMQV